MKLQKFLQIARQLSVVLVFSCFGLNTASATLVNFDDIAHPSIINNTYASSGVVFSGVSGADVQTWSTTSASLYPPGYSPLSDSNMAVNDTDQSGIRLDFGVSINSLSLYGVDYGGSDYEVATLAAYDGLGALLASTTVSSTRSSRTVEGVEMPTDIAFLSLDTVADIAFATFTYTGGTFFGIDDVEFSRVPLPSPLLLIVFGLLGLSLAKEKTLSQPTVQ